MPSIAYLKGVVSAPSDLKVTMTLYIFLINPGCPKSISFVTNVCEAMLFKVIGKYFLTSVTVSLALALVATIKLLLKSVEKFLSYRKHSLELVRTVVPVIVLVLQIIILSRIT